MLDSMGTKTSKNDIIIREWAQNMIHFTFCASHIDMGSLFLPNMKVLPSFATITFLTFYGKSKAANDLEQNS